MDYLIDLWKSFEQMTAIGKFLFLCVVVVFIIFLSIFWPKKLQPPGTGQEPE